MWRLVVQMFLTLPRVLVLIKFPEDRALEKKRRRLWVAFVQTKRAEWSPTDKSRLCSQHFKADDFESPFITIPGTRSLVARYWKSMLFLPYTASKLKLAMLTMTTALIRVQTDHPSVSKIVQCVSQFLYSVRLFEIYLTLLLLSCFDMTNVNIWLNRL